MSPLTPKVRETSRDTMKASSRITDAQAIVVGVEAYQARHLDREGIGARAVAQAQWLIQRGLPPDHIHLFLSLRLNDQNEPDQQGTKVGAPGKVRLYAPSGEQINVVPLFASRSEFIRFFSNKVRNWKNTESVILLWTGHGVVDTFDQRYLILADAMEEALTCVAVGTLRRLFRAQNYPPFGSVLGVIDSCAQPMNIPRDDLPIQTDRPAARKRPQYFLFSTSVGQLSTFVAPQSEKPSFAQRFHEVLQEIPIPPWPLSARRLRDRLDTALRTTSLTQTLADESDAWRETDEEQVLPRTIEEQLTVLEGMRRFSIPLVSLRDFLHGPGGLYDTVECVLTNSSPKLQQTKSVLFNRLDAEVQRPLSWATVDEVKTLLAPWAWLATPQARALVRRTSSQDYDAILKRTTGRDPLDMFVDILADIGKDKISALVHSVLMEQKRRVREKKDHEQEDSTEALRAWWKTVHEGEWKEAEPSSPLGTRLLFRVQPVGARGTQISLEWWLDRGESADHGGMAGLIPIGEPVTVAARLDAMTKPVLAAVREARQTDRGAESVRYPQVEFFLPLDLLLQMEVEEIPMPSGDLDMQPLAVRFPLALRSLERTFQPQTLNEPPGEWEPQRWHLRWECNANDTGVPLSEVPDEQEAYTALGQKPTARLCYDGSERGPILRAALKQGVSIVLWARGKTNRQQDVERVRQLLLTEDDEKTPVASDALLERFHELRRRGRIPTGVRMLFDPPFPFAEEEQEAQEFTDVGLIQPEGTEDEEEE